MSYESELREFLHLLDTVPVVGQPPRGPDREQMMRQLIELDPEKARRILADLDKNT